MYFNVALLVEFIAFSLHYIVAVLLFILSICVLVFVFLTKFHIASCSNFL